MLPGPDDRRLAKRLHRDARAAAKAQLRAELARARAIRRRERRIRKARAALPGQLVATVGLGLVSIPVDGFWGVAAVGTAFIAGLGALRSVRMLRTPEPPALPLLASLPAVPMPPPAGSIAFPYVRRLEAVRDELRRLLPLVAPAGRDAAEEAWQAAAEADAALRWQAARMAAVEPHRAVEADLLQSLEEGVCCSEQLVVAVADLVAASADPLATRRLQDAADALHGLAQGLREVR